MARFFSGLAGNHCFVILSAGKELSFVVGEVMLKWPHFIFTYCHKRAQVLPCAQDDKGW